MEKLKNVYLSWNGRVSRKTYWIYGLPIAIVFLIAEYLITPHEDTIGFLIILFIVYPSMMINIKRAHDRDRSGWFTLLLLIPIVSFWPLIEFGFIKGTEGDNKFGEPDKTWDT